MKTVLGAIACVFLVACPPSRAAAPPVQWTARAPKSHRPASAACAPHHRVERNSAPHAPTAPPDAGAPADTLALENGPARCSSDSDCTTAQRGFCKLSYGKGTQRLQCDYDVCVSDADCGGGGVCACHEDWAHRCVEGDCKVDGDCAAPGFCAFSFGADVMTSHGRVVDLDRGYFCRTLNDACIDDDDCVAERCAFVGERRRWECRAANSSDAP
jgi:hypothetical protein